VKSVSVAAIAAYAADVRTRSFPGPAESYHLAADVAETLGLYGSAG
jgi:ketopantoate hydroxymethyltransferase